MSSHLSLSFSLTSLSPHPSPFIHLISCHYPHLSPFNQSSLSPNVLLPNHFPSSLSPHLSHLSSLHSHHFPIMHLSLGLSAPLSAHPSSLIHFSDLFGPFSLTPYPDPLSSQHLIPPRKILAKNKRKTPPPPRLY
jgi:hypothetical protein